MFLIHALQYMDPEGGQRAMNTLHGKAIAKYSKPLVVEISHDVSVCVCVWICVCVCVCESKGKGVTDSVSLLLYFPQRSQRKLVRELEGKLQ